MKSACSSSAPGAFATPSAGFGYFATAEHYRHLAKAAADALHRGGVVLVSGDPPVCLAMLIEALRNAATPRAVIAISCGPALDFSAWYAGGGSPPQGQATPGSAQDGATGPTVLPFPIYVFDDADRLSDLQIEALLDATQAVPLNARTPRAGVLVANSSFPSWRRKPVPDLLEERFAAHLRLQQLDRDEIEAFIRYELPQDAGSNLLTAQRVALIAITSGGDPTVVNRLARRMLEHEPGAPAGSLLAKLSRSGARKPVGEGSTTGLRAIQRRSTSPAEEPGAPEGSLRARLPRVWGSGARKPVGEGSTTELGANIADDKIAPPRAMQRQSSLPEEEPGAPKGSLLAKLPRVWGSGARKPVGAGSTTAPGANIADDKIAPPRAIQRQSALPLKLAAGIIVCLGIVGLILSAFASGDFNRLLRDHVLPHKESGAPSEGVTARVALPVAPPGATDSSSAGAVESPRAPAASEVAAQPAEAGPERPSAAPSSPAASEPTGSPAPAGPRLSTDEIAALVARGDAFLGAGDIASARLFFQRAADAGDSRAAMRMAVTFDAAFLDRAGVRGLRGDPEQAAFWYRRAQDLGEVKTERGTPPSPEPPPQLR